MASGVSGDSLAISSAFRTARCRLASSNSAVVTVPERFFILPNTPSLKEEGYANVNVYNWFGVVAPAKTPQPIVRRLAEEIAATLKSDELKSKYRGMGLDVHPPMSQPDFNKFIASEIGRWGEVIKSANIRLD